MSNLYTVTLFIYLYAEYIMQNARQDEAQVGIKIARRNINKLRCTNDNRLMAESREGLKTLLMKVKDSEKSWLKSQHSKNRDHGILFHHFMASKRGNNRNSENILLGSQIAVDSDYSNEIKIHLLFGRKATTKLNRILKSKVITFPTKGHLINTMFFPVVIYGCEGWTIK